MPGSIDILLTQRLMEGPGSPPMADLAGSAPTRSLALSRPALYPQQTTAPSSPARTTPPLPQRQHQHLPSPPAIAALTCTQLHR